MKTLIFFISILIIFFFTNCGSEVTSLDESADLVSRIDPETITTSNTVVDNDEYGNALLTLCTPIESEDLNIQAALTVYFFDNSPSIDEVEFSLHYLPESFFSSNKGIQFQKLYEINEEDQNDKNIQVLRRPGYVTFDFVKKSNGDRLIYSLDTKMLSKRLIEDLIQAKLPEKNNYSVKDFLNEYNLVLKNVGRIYELIDLQYVSLNDENEAGDIIGNIESLIPAYPSSPDIYSKGKNSPGLILSHPMIENIGQNISENDFQLEIENKCNSILSSKL